MMKKVLLICLALLMTAYVFSSCGSSQSTASNETSISSTEIEIAETTTESPYGSLPDMNYNGYNFRFLVQDYLLEVHYGEMFLFAEEMNGEPVNDSVYARNKAIEDKFNVKITETRSQFPDIPGAARRAAQSGDDAFDVLDMSIGQIPTLALEGLIYNLKNSDYIDLTAPYWDQNFTEQLSPFGKVYMATGDISLSALRGLTTYYFNIGLVNDMNLDDPYELMQNDRWVFDKFKSMVIDVSADLNGNGEMDENDRYGMALEEFNTAVTSFGWFNLYLDNEGVPYIDMTPVLECNRYSELYEFFKNKTYTLDISKVKSGSNVYEQIRTVMFGSNQILFCSSNLRQGEESRYLDIDYGVVPCPKLDENQERYYSLSDYNWPAISILFNNVDIDRTCILLEAMARISSPIREAYYEQTLKEKYARSEYHFTAVDIVANSAFYDLSYTYFPINEKMRTVYTANPASAWARIEESMNTKLNEYLDIIKGLD